MALVVRDGPFVEPLAEATLKITILEIFAPKGTVTDASFGHGAIQVQHANQSRPGTAPICDRKNWTLMRREAMQHVMTVLPNAFCDYQRSVRVEMPKNLHSHFLGIDETVAFLFIKRMCTDDGPTLGFQSFG